MSQGGAIAVVGASETTLWTYWLIRNLREYRYPGAIWPVNPNRSTVYELDCFPSIDALPAAPDTAVLITSAERAVSSARDLVSRGTRELIVVSDGFRETATAEGAARERELVELATTRNVNLVGPNCVGLASFHDSFCGIAEPIPTGIQPGEVSVISQSGVLTHSVLAALKEEQLGVDVCYSIGNGAVLGFESALRVLGARSTTRTICCVVESIRDREALAEAVRAGRAAGVEFIFLLLGQSDDGKRVAKSHTGAVTGDQRLIRSWMRGLGVVVVDSLEELTRSARLLATVGRPGPGRGVFILTTSGGGAGLAADLCAAHQLPLAEISETTKARIQELVLPGTVVGNPLDTTNHGGPRTTREIFNLVSADPSVGILLDPYGLSWPDDTDERRWHRAGMDALLAAAEQAKCALIYASLMHQPTTDYMDRAASRPDVLVTTDLSTTISSLARLYRQGGATAPRADDPASVTDTSAVDGPVVDSPVVESPDRAVVDGSVIDEAPAREILEALGLPIVRGAVADTPETTAALADGLRAPWVAKLAISGLGHKGRVGGVRLGLCTREDVASACREMAAAVVEQGIADSSAPRFMIQEMEFGQELLVGLVRDQVTGPGLIVGIGGWAAESASIFAAVPLAASLDIAVDIAEELRRGQLSKLVGTDRIERLTALLVQLGVQFTTGELRHYDVVECNPVILSAQGPRIADALLVRP